MRPIRFLLLTLLPAALTTAAPATGGSISLELSPEPAAHGETLTAAGTVSADPGCLASRPVRLERRGHGVSPWVQVAEATTTHDGTFAMEVVAESNATFRAVAAAMAAPEACEETASPEVAGTVRAAVRAETARPRPAVGSCPRVDIEVSPPKPGHSVMLERRGDDGWSEAASAELGPGSRAAVTVCTAWGDLGPLVLRATWPAQDELHEGGASSSLSLQVVRATWMRRLDRLAGPSSGISVREEGSFIYRHGDTRRRIPASNQKLLMSMALLDALPADSTLPTRALGRLSPSGLIRGDLWLVGAGDPEVGRADLGRIADRLRAAGVRRVGGSVRGSTRGLARDWWAPGWRPYFPSTYVARPTALTYRGNSSGGRHVREPEVLAAAELTRQLRRRGIRVARAPGTGRHPGGFEELASAESRTVEALLATTNTYSSNFRAEVLGKILGAHATGGPGSIAGGARATEAWARTHGVSVLARDASGLSYANRISPAAMVRLLDAAEDTGWGEALREGLASPGRGTLEHRLEGVPVRAKTGTLTGVSALSGWVLAARLGTWVEFSVISGGLSTTRAKAIEDAVVRAIRRRV